MNSVPAIASIFLFAAGLYIFRKSPRSSLSSTAFFLLSFTCLLMYTAWQVADYFSGRGIDEASLYHVRYGLAGAGHFEYIGLMSMAFLALAAGFILLLWLVTRRSPGPQRQYGLLSAFLLVIAALLLNPATVDLYQLYGKGTNTPGSSTDRNTDFYNYYKEPFISETENKRKNLVFIYAESLERTYFNEDVFPGLVTELRDLQDAGINFTEIRDVPGANWTVAGMIASLCGIPLVTPSHGNSMGGMDQFLSSAVCLGDLLKDHGYHLAYLGGANSEFAGKDKLLTSHGFDEVAGRSELINRISDTEYHSSWGLFDDSLFELAYERFLELSRSGRNFGLFTLTLDTHPPAGHPSAGCDGRNYADGSNPILNAVACSDYLVSGFIRKIMESPHAGDTVIVLASDHLAMRNTAYDTLRQQKRRNLFMLFTPGDTRSLTINSSGSMLDIAPTLLPFLGFTGEIGLGRDLVNSTAATEKERKYIHQRLENWKPELAAFWDFPRIRGSLEVKLDEQRIQIDNRSFRFPVLIELNEQLETMLRFSYHRAGGHKSLVEHRRGLSSEDYFILVDRCNNARKLDPILGRRGTCILAGQGKKYTHIARLDKNIRFNVDELRNLLGMPEGFTVHRVAHAGGGIDKTTYTNSIDALNHNIGRGFRYFEIDLLFSRDGKLLCLHDWDNNFKRLFGFEPAGKLTRDEFLHLAESRSRYQNCTIESLAEWMQNNPDANIVTDIKENNIRALKSLVEILPDARKRVIPQIYRPDDFRKVKKIGFEQIIWTLYRFRGTDDEVLSEAENFSGRFAITMPQSRARSNLPARLRAKNISTYVHTVNSAEEASRLKRQYGVSEIYTDFLPP